MSNKNGIFFYQVNITFSKIKSKRPILVTTCNVLLETTLLTHHYYHVSAKLDIFLFLSCRFSYQIDINQHFSLDYSEAKWDWEAGEERMIMPVPVYGAG